MTAEETGDSALLPVRQLESVFETGLSSSKIVSGNYFGRSVADQLEAPFARADRTDGKNAEQTPEAESGDVGTEERDGLLRVRALAPHPDGSLTSAALFAENTATPTTSARPDLGLTSKQIESYNGAFTGSNGKRFKELATWAAREVGLDPGLVAENLITEAKRDVYLSAGKVSSYEAGVDDFYERRRAVAAVVSAFSKIKWDESSRRAHPNDAKTPRLITTIDFATGKDAALASAVTLKYFENHLINVATKQGSDFAALPIETRYALLRLAFNAGIGRARRELVNVLAGREVLVRTPRNPAGPQRRATIHAGRAIYLTGKIFGGSSILHRAEESGYEPVTDQVSERWEEQRDDDAPAEIESAFSQDWEFEARSLLSSVVETTLLRAQVGAARGSGGRAPDRDALTNSVFYLRHPNLRGTRIPASDRALAAEWKGIRDELVAPELLAGPRLGPIHGGPQLRNNVPDGAVISPLSITQHGLRGRSGLRKGAVSGIVVHNTSRGPVTESAAAAYRKPAVDYALDFYLTGSEGFPHYVVDLNGTIWATCDERREAWHTSWKSVGGGSYFRGKWTPRPWWYAVWNPLGARTPLDLLPSGVTHPNASTIGIELIILPTLSFTPQQYTSLAKLVVDISTRQGLAIDRAPSKQLLGHEDFAPYPYSSLSGREGKGGGVDPGAHREDPYFHWSRLWSEMTRVSPGFGTRETEADVAVGAEDEAGFFSPGDGEGTELGDWEAEADAGVEEQDGFDKEDEAPDTLASFEVLNGSGSDSL